MDFDGVVSAYTKGESQKAIARRFDISPQAVRRIFVSNGCMPSGYTDEINRLYNHGYSVSDIASRFGITDKAVMSHLPYIRGSYLTDLKDKTANARRIIRFRNKSV